MSLSQESPHSDDQLVRYLLGQLTDEEAERVDELSIADEEAAWRLRAAEDDLVDAYVRGRLDDLTRSRFERVYLVTPKRREKVKFARQLSATLDRLAPGPAPAIATAATTSSWRGWFERLVPRTSIGWTLATAAAALVIVCGALLFQTARL